MSHFAVLVIGDDVEAQMAPFHRFEWTGRDDQYVREIDRLAELRAEFRRGTEVRVLGPDGSLSSLYDEKFYRDPTPEEAAVIAGAGGGRAEGFSYSSRDWGDGRGNRPKVRFVPDGHAETEVAMSRVRTFAEWLEGRHGWERVAEGEEPDRADVHKFGWYRATNTGEVTEVIRRTNPDQRWDWWIVGGRWTGFFKLLPGRKGVVGRPGLFTEAADSVRGYADCARKGDIDFAAMRDEAGARAAAAYDAVHAVIAGRHVRSWDEVLSAHRGDVDAARPEFEAQQVVQAIRASADDRVRWIVLDDFLTSREAYVRAARNTAGHTFAVVKDGRWFERGASGWWGGAVGENDAASWDREFPAMVDRLPGDTLLTVVDCHS